MSTVEQWLGKENTLGIDIWRKKYQCENETFDEWLDRVSGNDSELKKQIIDKKFLSNLEMTEDMESKEGYADIYYWFVIPLMLLFVWDFVCNKRKVVYL